MPFPTGNYNDFPTILPRRAALQRHTPAVSQRAAWLQKDRAQLRKPIPWRAAAQSLVGLIRNPRHSSIKALCTDSNCSLKEMSTATGAGGFPQAKATFLPWADTKFLLSAAKTLQRGHSQNRSKVIWALTKHSLLFNQEGCTGTLMKLKPCIRQIQKHHSIEESTNTGVLREGAWNYLTLPFAKKMSQY